MSDRAPGADAAAQRLLAGLAGDPIAGLARRFGVVAPDVPSLALDVGGPLGRLSLSIIGQQISTRAAAAVYGRLRARLGSGPIDASRLAALSDDELRALGLSYAKARAVRALAAEVASGTLDLTALADLSDEEARRRLVALRGIGPWSADIFLLRELRRPDVFPAGDMGLRRALVGLDGLTELPSIPAVAKRALAWRPWRSYAAKYLWLAYAERGPGRGSAPTRDRGR